jgi:hypothetical protein
VFTKSLTEDFIRIDRPRLEYIFAHLAFDDDRNLIKIPDWQTLLDGIAEIPLKSAAPLREPPLHDPVMELWQQQVVKPGQSEPETQQRYDIYELQNPCTGCQAYCCQSLIFPQHKPLNYSNLDYLRFSLGFPGVELGIADEGWSLVLKVTCRHLSDHRCAVYGQPDRPLLCKYYDEWKCTYKERLGRPRPAGFFRVKLEHFHWLLECFQFDAAGTIVSFPSTEAIRRHLENCWQAELSSVIV